MRSHTRTASGDFQLSRWMMILVALAMAAALAVPLVPANAQTESTGDVIDLVPGTALIYAQADLDTTSEQAMLAIELFERAGLTDLVEEEAGATTEDIPANLQVALVVTSIPETDDFDVDAVAMDPMAATNSLDSGGFAAIISGDDITAITDETLADMESDASLGYGEITESEYSGITITSFESSDEYTDSSAVATVGNYTVIAMRAEDIRPLIDTYNGDTTSLAANEQYQQIISLLPSPLLSNGWVNGPAIIDAVSTSAPEAISSLDDATLGTLEAVSGFAFTAEQQGFRLETRSIPIEPDVESAEMLDGSFVDTVPSDALFLTNGNDIDSTGLVTLIAYLFASELVGVDMAATPVADMSMQDSQDEIFAEAESLLGFNLKTDFIDNLVGEYGFVLTIGNITAEVPTVDALIVSDVADAEAVEDVLNTLSFIVGAGLGDQTSIESRDVNGSHVNSVDITETGVADRVEYGVVNNELVISVGTGLDDYINGAEAPLSQDENFTALMSNLPSEYSALTYINMREVVRMVTDFSDSMAFTTEDADISCGEYATQDEAQAALDEDPFENFMLDQDFDGEACEDYFAPATAASPVAEAANPYENVLGLATVMHEEDGISASSTFFLIGDN